MSYVFTVPDQISADRLTSILRGAGVPESGAVATFAIGPNPAFNSAIWHLRITYSSDASPGAPGALVLKRNLPEEWAREAGKAEVAFYTHVRSLRDELPMIVPCYDAVYDPHTRDSHLLLLDLSESHEPLVTREDLIALRGVPTETRLEAVVTAGARLHAHWWEHRSLDDGSRDVSGWYGTRERFDDRIERRRREWDIFRAGPGMDLPGDILDLYSHLFDRLPRLWDRGFGDRVISGKNRTVVHGDCYLSQFLYPRDGTGATYLLDWQGGWIDLPSFDLTHLFTTFWTPKQRHDCDREQLLLHQYLTSLAGAGVTGYGWEQLQYDYRVLLLYMVLHPVWDAVDGSDTGYWWPKMRCLTSAYRDWECAELLA